MSWKRFALLSQLQSIDWVSDCLIERCGAADAQAEHGQQSGVTGQSRATGCCMHTQRTDLLTALPQSMQHTLFCGRHS